MVRSTGGGTALYRGREPALSLSQGKIGAWPAAVVGGFGSRLAMSAHPGRYPARSGYGRRHPPLRPIDIDSIHGKIIRKST